MIMDIFVFLPEYLMSPSPFGEEETGKIKSHFDHY